MTAPSVDPASIRAGLERQLALLAPVAEHLHAAAIGPSPLVADEWRGPAAEAASAFLDELRARLRDAEAATDDVVRTLRVHLGGMP